ncbi:MAG: Fe-S cluster assembly protein SufD [Alphaproteobacteria bacterium]
MSESIPTRAERYADHRAHLPGAGLAWLDRLRDAAMDAFTRTGLPTRRMEDWKYVDLRALAETDWRPAGPGLIVRADLPPPLVRDGERIVLVDGRFRADLSDRIAGVEGLTILSLHDALTAGDPLAAAAFGPCEWHARAPLIALNTAMAGDGVVLSVADGARIERPVEVLHWTTAHDAPAEIHARHAILLHERARATVIERFAGANGAAVFANHGCHVALAMGASLDHIRVQSEPANLVHIAATGATLAQGAVYRGGYVGLGAATARVDLNAALLGERAELDLAAVYLARGAQQNDLTTRIQHAARACSSAQLVKGVVAGRARGVFQGAIHVDQDAQKTEAKQYSRALLLSPLAEVDTKPELRIFADDVQCAHGAAIGELNRDHLFYLRARGIDEPTARALLVEAFIAEVVERIPDADVRALVAGLTAAWLAEETDR